MRPCQSEFESGLSPSWLAWPVREMLQLGCAGEAPRLRRRRLGNDATTRPTLRDGPLAQARDRATAAAAAREQYVFGGGPAGGVVGLAVHSPRRAGRCRRRAAWSSGRREASSCHAARSRPARACLRPPAWGRAGSEDRNPGEDSIPQRPGRRGMVQRQTVRAMPPQPARPSAPAPAGPLFTGPGGPGPGLLDHGAACEPAGHRDALPFPHRFGTVPASAHRKIWFLLYPRLSREFSAATGQPSRGSLPSAAK